MSTAAQIDLDAKTRRLTLSPHEPAFVQDPYAVYSLLHEHARSVFWNDYGHWCFAGYDDVNRLLRDRRFGRERPGGYMAVANESDRAHLAAFDRVEAGSLLELEPPAHSRLRTLVNRAFVSRQVERLRPSLTELAHALIDTFPRGEPFDLLTAFATPLPATVIAEMMGLPRETGSQLVAWSNDMVRMYMHRPTRPVEEQANASSAAFAAFIREHAEQRRSKPSDDLLGVLVSAGQDGDRLSEDELVSSAILILNAGHEATVHQIGNAVKAITAEGDDPGRFFIDERRTSATVEECLRYDAPLHMFTRYAYSDMDLGDGVVLKTGDQIGLLLGAANRDPAAFAAPHRFDPLRADQKTAAFGAGIHFCVGAPLARLELQIAIKALFDRCPGLAIVEPPIYRDSYHFHGLERLMVRV